MELRDEVISSRGAHDVDTSANQLSDPNNVEFSLEKNQQDVDVVFTPGTDTQFCPSTFNDFEMSSIIENPTLIDEEQDRETSPPTTPVSERPTQTLVLMRSHPFRRRTQKVPDSVPTKLFEEIMLLIL